MAFRRRDFLKLAEAIGAAAVYADHQKELNRLFAQATDGGLHVIWLRGAGDPRFAVTFAEDFAPDLADVLVMFRRAVDFHPTLMLPSSDRALVSLSNALAGRSPLDLLIVEGAGPSGSPGLLDGAGGRLVPFEFWVKDLSAVAKKVVVVGRCAALADVDAFMTIPGCPPRPDLVFLAIATALSESIPHLPAEDVCGPAFRQFVRAPFHLAVN